MPMIEKPEKYRIALLHLGFRPFFLASAGFAVVSMLIWALIYQTRSTFFDPALPPSVWHAHEMLFGYTLGVIAGFLLTAARNWTNVQTSRGIVLFLLVALWVIPRITIFMHEPWAWYVTVACDTVFDFALVSAIAYPIVRVRQWKQLSIVALVLIMALANVIFYAERLNLMQSGVAMGLNLGLNAAIFLVLLMGRRVIPFFIEKGLDIPTLRNRDWLDTGLLILMAALVVLEAAETSPMAIAAAATIMSILQTIRLWDWHRPEIWRKPLLWSLYIAFVWLDIGFILKALSSFDFVATTLALHAYVVGGLGLITFSMMCRVTLGHTGRDVFHPPQALQIFLMLLVVAAILRVGLPWFFPAYAQLWIGIAQVSWSAAFAGFFWIFAKVLVLPRVDGRYG